MATVIKMFETPSHEAGWMLDVLSEPINRYRVSDRIVTYCNRAWADHYRMEPSAVIGRCLDDFLSPDELDGLHTQLALIGPDCPVLVDSAARVDSGKEQRWLQWVDHYVTTETGPEILSVGRDVTERHVAERALADSEMRFRTLADASSDIVWRVRRPGLQFDYLSPSIATVLGSEPSYFIEDISRFLDRAEPESRTIIERMFTGDHTPDRIDLRLQHDDGRLVIVETSVSYGENAIQGVARDVTEVRNLQRSLATNATTDALTGLANRRLFDEALGNELVRTGLGGSALAVAYIDLDRLKGVNDRYGHDAGDVVLRESARRLVAAADGSDIVARLGGDEFAIIHEVRDDSLERVIQRLAERFQAPFSISTAISVACSASIGVASTADHGRDAGRLVAAADRAMYEHKRSRPHR